jgi:hypothetical protein
MKIQSAKNNTRAYRIAAALVTVRGQAQPRKHLESPIEPLGQRFQARRLRGHSGTLAQTSVSAPDAVSALRAYHSRRDESPS